VTSVGLHIAAEGGDLVENPLLIQHSYGAVFDPDRDRAGEEPLHLFRCG
jgi:hypothetical protein